jgi:hypothetical protein
MLPNAARIGDPDERFWIGVGFNDETVDSDLEVLDGAKDTPLQAPPFWRARRVFAACCYRPDCDPQA